MKAVRINVFKSSRNDFIHMLQENNIEHREVNTFSDRIMASSMVLTVYGLLKTAAPWAALATVLVAWIKSRSTRKIIITTKDNQTIHAEGLSTKEIEQILEIAINLSVIDTNNKPKP
ncbi:effector-associated constant component EACC1 [Pseudomonas citronellolis]|uniref:effector-associated constant component EACC1 n=1 Tax=Pseudomonas citronellolis TaxID=53408 RepID=UPI000A71C321|nr:hypothetical protein [Pseudomonas citronellolis]